MQFKLEKFKAPFGVKEPIVKTETIETRITKPEIENLLPETLEFMKNHLDMAGFNPEIELTEIRQFIRMLPPESETGQRRALIREFKRKLKILRETNTNIQIEIEKVLRENPDIPEQYLESKIGKIIRLSPDVSYADFFRGVKLYFETRDKVKSVIDRYKMISGELWQNELFKDLFGRYPKGEIQITQTLNGIFIQIHDLEDYVFAYVVEKNDNNQLVFQQQDARVSGGALLNRDFTDIPQLSHLVTIENSSLDSQGEFSQGTKEHEEEHAVHSKLYPYRLFQFSNTITLFEKRNQTIGLEEFLDRIRKCAGVIITGFENDAKTEILAYLKTNDHRGIFKNIKSSLLDEDGLYNYFRNRDTKNYFIDEIFGILNILSLKIERNGIEVSIDELKQICAMEISRAWHKNYKKTLKLALTSVETLLAQYGDNPENRLKIIRLLIQEPMEKWPRLVRILS